MTAFEKAISREAPITRGTSGFKKEGHLFKGDALRLPPDSEICRTLEKIMRNERDVKKEDLPDQRRNPDREGELGSRGL